MFLKMGFVKEWKKRMEAASAQRRLKKTLSSSKKLSKLKGKRLELEQVDKFEREIQREKARLKALKGESGLSKLAKGVVSGMQRGQDVVRKTKRVVSGGRQRSGGFSDLLGLGDFGGGDFDLFGFDSGSGGSRKRYKKKKQGKNRKTRSRSIMINF